ncbi:MAG TPA: hypothetical protein PKD53_19330 [Chloroflexaceae bacterium]|nr:hypothetical protein [Chloroflexaceae bacterium]
MPSPLTAGRRLLLAVALAAAAAALAAPAGRLAVAMALLLFAPGYLLERALPGPRPHAVARLAVWVALSLSAVALFYQWAWAVGQPLGDLALWLGAGTFAAAPLAAAWRDRGRPGPPASPEGAWAAALTAAIVGATFATRLAHVEGLALPPWVDSVHHALLVRLAAETGSAPASLAPYLPVRDLPYHWGYHVVVATAMRLGGPGLPETLMLSGQLLNALHALTAAGLAVALWRRPTAGPAAALVVGLVSLMPAYYLSWGRYTQLAGLLMVPGLAIAWQQGLAGRGRGWWAAAALALAGLSLVHFRVLILAGALLAALSLAWAAGRPWGEVRGRLVAAVAAGVAGAALTAPWLALLVGRALLPAVADGGLAGGGSYNALNEGLLWVEPNRLLAALAMAAGLAGLARRRAVAAALALWVGLMALLANPWLLAYLLAAVGLALVAAAIPRRRLARAGAGAALLLSAALGPPPYLWLITNDVVVISLFLPFAALIGGGAAMLYGRLAALGPATGRALPWAWAAALAGVGVWGAAAMDGRVLNQTTVLARPADRAAIAWVAAETPPEARFLVNAAPWLPTARRGADGGWWLLPLAGRATTMPPVLYVYGPPDYVARVNAVADAVIGYAPGGERAILDLVAAEGVTHIYLAEGVGPLTAEIFAGRPGFTPVYAQDGVTIFAVDEPAGAP